MAKSSNFLKKCDFRAVQRSALCRSRRALSNAYFFSNEIAIQTHIYLQKLASIQPRTSPVKFLPVAAPRPPRPAARPSAAASRPAVPLVEAARRDAAAAGALESHPVGTPKLLRGCVIFRTLKVVNVFNPVLESRKGDDQDSCCCEPAIEKLP